MLKGKAHKDLPGSCGTGDQVWITSEVRGQMRQATVMLHFVVQEAEDGLSVIAQNRAKTLIKDYVVAFVIKLSILCFLCFVALCLVVISRI